MRRALCLLLTFVVLISILPPAGAAQTTNSAIAQDSYYGRNALCALENATALLYAYDRLVAGVAAAEETISVYDGVHPLTQAQLQTVMDAYRRDHVSHFWLGNSYRMMSNGTSIIQVLPSYNLTGAALEVAKDALEAKANAILSGITDAMSEYEKALYLHDTLADIIVYEESENAHNAYGALVEGKAVCEGYAEALQYLLQLAGLRCFIAEGASLDPATGAAVAHAWNYVYIDAECYHIDLTWDDQGDTVYHAYFCQSDAVIQEDHALSETGYRLPSCASNAAQFFTGSNAYLDSYTSHQVAALLKQNQLQAHVYIPGSVDAFLSWYGDNILDIASQTGITGGFSYGYSRLGHELVLTLKRICSHNYVDGICHLCGSINASSGATVVLRSDLSTEELTVPAGVTLDLNGFYVSARSAVSFGNIIDTAGAGCLSANNLVLTDNSYLPIYDSCAGGYRFFAFALENLGIRTTENGAVFGFALAFTDIGAYELLATEEAPGLEITANLSWENSDKSFLFDNALLQEYALLQLQYPQLHSALMLKVVGIDCLASGCAITVTPGISVGQLTYTGSEMTHLVD